MKGFLVFPIIFFLLFCPPNFADFQNGLKAFRNQDYETALDEWKPLAKRGDVQAQHYLGSMYKEGKGVIQDYETAIDWYTLAAEQGYTNAQRSLGDILSIEFSAWLDIKAAIKWYTLAAEQGDVWALVGLGDLYTGLYLELYDKPDRLPRAHMWFNLAVSQGNIIAEYRRDELQKTMTSVQIVEAQKLARECVSKNLKGC